MSKIYLSNFPRRISKSNKLKSKKNNKYATAIVGFEIDNSSEEVKQNLIQSVFLSLVLYDSIFISIWDVQFLIKHLGMKDTTLLCSSGYFKFINDKGVGPVILQKGHTYESTFGSGYTDMDGNFLDFYEHALHDKYPSFKTDIDKIIQFVEENQYHIDPNSIIDKVRKETEFDFKNQNISEYLALESKSLMKIDSCDVFKVLRIKHLNSSLVTSSLINSDELILDPISKNYLNYKLSPIIKEGITKNNFNLFTEIFSKKGIPDFGHLYINKIISIQDILGYRENLDGKLFRHWVIDNDMSDEELKNYFYKNSPSNKGSIIKHVRWFYPTFLKLIDFPTGLAMSYVDRFLLDKIYNSDWKPTLFIDNLLQKNINEAVDKYNFKLDREKFMKRFNNVSRNDLCPCGSGLKYKKCHLSKF